MLVKRTILLLLASFLILPHGKALAKLNPWTPNPATTTLPPWFHQPGREWLRDLSTWFNHVDRRDVPIPLPNFHGAMAVGNGTAFTILGMTYPFNGTHNTTGLHYQVPGNFFSDTDLKVVLDGTVQESEQEWIWWVRKTAIVITKSEGPAVDLTTIAFVPQGLDAIVHICIVTNHSSEIQRNAGLEARIYGNGTSATDGVGVLQNRNPRIMALDFLTGARTTTDESVRLSLGDLGAGDERVIIHVQSFSTNESGRQAVLNTIRQRGAGTLLLETRDWWREWRSHLADLVTPNTMVNDYWDVILITNKVQQSAQGTVSPMSRYTKAYLRDDFAACLLFDRAGWYDDVYRTLDYFYKACRVTSSMPNSIGMDVDVSDPLPPEPDWPNVGIMHGRRAAEAPCYLALKFWNLYQHTGDLNFIRDRYEFLKRSLTGQEFSLDYLLPLSGDEPWRWVFFGATGMYEPENLMWSAYSSFIFVPAAEYMARFAELLGKPDDVTLFRDLGQRVRNGADSILWHPDGFWSPGQRFADGTLVEKPFEDINTFPLWTGYSPPDDPMILSNLDAVIRHLLRADGALISDPMALKAYDGMVPGQWLQNLAVEDHPLGEAAFNSLFDTLLPSGETAEGHWYDDKSALTLVYDRTGANSDISARFRPWEGGCNAEGMMIYLTGLSTDYPHRQVSLFPHLPNGWTHLAMNGNRIGETWYDLQVAVTPGPPEYRRYTVTSRTPGGEDFNVNLTASFGPEFDVARVALNGQDLDASEWSRTEWFGREQVTPWRFKVPGSGQAVMEFWTDMAPTPTPAPTMTPTRTPRPTRTPSPTPTVPTATPSPTPTTCCEPSALAVAGYLSTYLNRTEGGRLTFYAFAPDVNGQPVTEVELLAFGQPTGVTLTPGDPGVFQWSLAAGGGVAPGRVLLQAVPKVGRTPGQWWPYLTVGE